MKSQPIAFDLCCGEGGWTDGLLKYGFKVIGFDIVQPVRYKGRFILEDVLKLRQKDLRGVDFVVASTPCQEFAVHGMKHFHPNPPFPKNGIKIFKHVEDLCEEAGMPYVMENVRAAQKFVGDAVNHAGSFYMWGDSVPTGKLPSLTKGMTQMRPDKSYMRGGGVDAYMYGDKSARARQSAIIPAALSSIVGKHAINLVSGR